MMIPADIRQSIQEVTGLLVTAAEPVSGGCIHHGCRVDTDQGSFFLKYNEEKEADNFLAEVRGLKLLAEAGTVRIPQVRDTGSTGSHAWLLMEWIEPGSRSGDFETRLGHQLAQLHQHTAPQYGLDHDNFIGRLPQSNDHRDSWPAFFLEQRIFPMAYRAQAYGYLDKEDLAKVEALASRVEDLFPEAEPALLHGDLWGGNLLADQQGQPVLIDPAVYYGHPEMELAFMTMFDRYSQKFYQAYQDISPLEKGYHDRFDLYNLYPQLVHVCLFGHGYIAGVRITLRRYAG